VEHIRVQGDVAIATEQQPPPEFKTVEPMFLHQDHRGWIWLGSGSGVYVFNGERWRHLTKNDGLAWNDCNEGSFLEDTDGSIWIGTSNGLSHLLHPEVIFQQKPLQVIITSAAVGNESLASGSSTSIPWTKEPLLVHVVSSPLEDQPSTVYRYRMAGLEKDWSRTRSHDLHYPSLTDGTYRLELFAEDTESGIRSPIAFVSFRISPPWWKSPLFEVSVGIVFLLLVFLGLRHRERELVSSQARLEALVRERTEQLELEKQQLTEAREALHEQASRDPLTGLLNRRAIYDVLGREMARIRRDRSTLTAVMIDLDHFKAVNDTHGHMAGDEVLREIANRLTESIRPYDAISRYGGEEFLLIMPDINAVRERDRLLMVHEAVCREPIRVAGGEVTVTCSFGVSILFSDEKTSVEQFLDRADRALYEAKRMGRNRIAYDAPAHVV
jgi:diguanylate cyclase (GGDEF)-like protein